MQWGLEHVRDKSSSGVKKKMMEVVNEKVMLGLLKWSKRLVYEVHSDEWHGLS